MEADIKRMIRAVEMNRLEMLEPVPHFGLYDNIRQEIGIAAERYAPDSAFCPQIYLLNQILISFLLQLSRSGMELI